MIGARDFVEGSPFECVIRGLWLSCSGGRGEQLLEFSSDFGHLGLGSD